MHLGFIGLGNVGGKLAVNLLGNGDHLTVRDLDETAASAAVLEAEDGLLAGLVPDTVRCESSTTDASEGRRLA